jgi:hypothetical protein
LQVAQVLLTLPYSFSQLGMVSGLLLQVFYGLMGSWTAYLISVLYVEYRARKEKEGVSFKNHVIQVGPSLINQSVSRHHTPLCWLACFSFTQSFSFVRFITSSLHSAGAGLASVSLSVSFRFRLSCRIPFLSQLDHFLIAEARLATR